MSSPASERPQKTGTVLRTALKPRWLGALAGVLVLVAAFLWLSHWQLERSQRTEGHVVFSKETPVPLQTVLEPMQSVTNATQDQMVTVEGTFDVACQAVVRGRIREGETGYWVVTGFVVREPKLQHASGPEQFVMPVVRGWVRDIRDAPGPPHNVVRLTGRLAPTEAPRMLRDLAPQEMSAVASAEAVNRWNVSSYRAFVVAREERTATGENVGAFAQTSPLKGVTLTPQPAERPLNWLNLFYAVEWMAFSGFVLFVWWRLVVDDCHRSRDGR